MNRDELLARALERINVLERNMKLIEQTYPRLIQVVEALMAERPDVLQAVARLEAHTFGALTVLLRSGALKYADLVAAMEELPGTDDLLVLWGVRTPEEAQALREAAIAAAKKEAEANEAAADEEEAAAPSPPLVRLD